MPPKKARTKKDISSKDTDCTRIDSSKIDDLMKQKSEVDGLKGECKTKKEPFDDVEISSIADECDEMLNVEDPIICNNLRATKSDSEIQRPETVNSTQKITSVASNIMDPAVFLLSLKKETEYVQLTILAFFFMMMIKNNV